MALPENVSAVNVAKFNEVGIPPVDMMPAIKFGGLVLVEAVPM